MYCLMAVWKDRQTIILLLDGKKMNFNGNASEGLFNNGVSRLQGKINARENGLPASVM